MKAENSSSPDWSDCFVSGVPAGCLFKMAVDELRKVVRTSVPDASTLNSVIEVSLVGLVAYFEGFCKNQFASVINTCPEVLRGFCERRPETSLCVSDALEVGLDLRLRLGSLLAEKLDFGSARGVNTLYGDLLSITPFSKDEARRYDELVSDRNLLVHHAGIYTLAYCKRKPRQSERNRVFWDSLVVKGSDFLKWSDFLEGIAAKLVSSSHEALVGFIAREGVTLSGGLDRALDWLSWYDNW